MTRDELYNLGRRLYDAAYEVIIGPSKGGNVSTDPNADPRDERIAELEAQLAQAQSGKADDAAKSADEPEAPEAPVEVSYDEAKAKVDAGEELTNADVAALERGPAK